jgi:hypothetical protein
LLFGFMSSKCEKDIIECGTAEREVVERQASGVEIAYNVGEKTRAVGNGYDDATPLGIHMHGASGMWVQRMDGGIEITSTGNAYLQALATHLLLEFVRGSTCDDLAMINDNNLIGKQVGFLKILRGQQDRCAIGDKTSDDLPHACAATRVESGGRLIEKEHGWRDDKAGGKVETAAHTT